MNEERRLFYGSLTQSRDWLYVCFPQRYYHGFRASHTDQYGYAQLTRFITRPAKRQFQCRSVIACGYSDGKAGSPSGRAAVRKKVRAMWD